MACGGGQEAAAFVRIRPDTRFKQLNIFAVFQDASQRLFNGVRFQNPAVELEQCFRPVQGFGNARPFY